uniref:Uncharacterized protein n=1 Tax=Cacopsylla melanoneura TaxID=428564 RepID=A0A8D8TEF7_9HEMI
MDSKQFLNILIKNPVVKKAFYSIDEFIKYKSSALFIGPSGRMVPLSGGAFVFVEYYKFLSSFHQVKVSTKSKCPCPSSPSLPTSSKSYLPTSCKSLQVASHCYKFQVISKRCQKLKGKLSYHCVRSWFQASSVVNL